MKMHNYCKIYHFDENSSLWWKFITVMKVHHCDENSSLWWKFIPVMKIHPCDENSLHCQRDNSCHYSARGISLAKLVRTTSFPSFSSSSYFSTYSTHLPPSSIINMIFSFSSIKLHFTNTVHIWCFLSCKMKKDIS